MTGVYQKPIAPALGLGRTRGHGVRKFLGDVGSGRTKGLDGIELGTELPRRRRTEAARVDAPIAAQIKAAVVGHDAVESFPGLIARLDNLHDTHVPPVPPKP